MLPMEIFCTSLPDSLSLSCSLAVSLSLSTAIFFTAAVLHSTIPDVVLFAAVFCTVAVLAEVLCTAEVCTVLTLLLCVSLLPESVLALTLTSWTIPSKVAVILFVVAISDNSCM